MAPTPTALRCRTKAGDYEGDYEGVVCVVGDGMGVVPGLVLGVGVFFLLHSLPFSCFFAFFFSPKNARMSRRSVGLLACRLAGFDFVVHIAGAPHSGYHTNGGGGGG